MLHRAMVYGVRLLQGERVVWAGLRGWPPHLASRRYSLAFVWVSLADILGYRRTEEHSRGRVVATFVTLSLRGGLGVASVGPVLDCHALTSLLDGLISRDIDPTMMRSLDGQPAAVEQRKDIFVAIHNRTEGDAYGPLIIGPRGLVRFTATLPIALEGLLLTALAAPLSAPGLEGRALFLARRPDAGHALIVDLAETELGMDGASLRVTMKDRTERIDLDDADVMRASSFIKERRASVPAGS